jgi:hypothetical protein
VNYAKGAAGALMSGRAVEQHFGDLAGAPRGLAVTGAGGHDGAHLQYLKLVANYDRVGGSSFFGVALEHHP